MRQIIVKIKDGATSVEAQGFKGSSCKEATKALENALGKVTSDEETSEMHEVEEERLEYLDEGNDEG